MENINDSTRSGEKIDDERASLLYSVWGSLLTGSLNEENESLRKLGLNKSNVPNAPHFESCESKARLNKRLDKRSGNENFPPWTSWKGKLELYPAAVTNERFSYYKHEAASLGDIPPWVRSKGLKPTTLNSYAYI